MDSFLGRWQSKPEVIDEWNETVGSYGLTGMKADRDGPGGQMEVTKNGDSYVFDGYQGETLLFREIVNVEEGAYSMTTKGDVDVDVKVSLLFQDGKLWVDGTFNGTPGKSVRYIENGVLKKEAYTEFSDVIKMELIKV